jgi:transcriptional regulator with XRE-family HTH domain
MSDPDNTRAQILGNLIQEARLYASRSVEETAVILNLPPQTYAQMETGKRDISLPELEVLALYFKVPMGYFWGRETLNVVRPVDYQNMILLRQRLIGVTLRQLRLKARQSTEDLANLLGVGTETIMAYEAGETAVPYLHLETLSRHLEGSINQFMEDHHGPLARHEARQRLEKIFNELDPDMQEFLANPTNISYIGAAKTLSKMDVQRLRQFAESILDITF